MTRKALHVAATLYKRGFQPVVASNAKDVDCRATEERECLWAVMRDWLGMAASVPSASAFTLRLLVIELLQAVLRSFLVSSSSLGLGYDFHYRCHCAFEELYLRKTYVLAKEMMLLCVAAAADDAPGEGRNEPRQCCLNASMDLVSELYGWNWNGTLELSNFLWSAIRAATLERVTVCVPESWAFFVTSPELFMVFTQCFVRCPNSDTGSAALRALTASASFSGGCLSKDKTVYNQFLQWQMTACMECMRAAASLRDVTDVCTLVERLVRNNHTMNMVQVPLWRDWLHTCTEFTLRVARALEHYADLESVEDSEEMSAMSTLVTAWSTIAKVVVHRAHMDTEKVRPFCRCRWAD